MEYILDARYRFRGWHGNPYGIYDTWTRKAVFFNRRLYELIMKCDAAHPLDPDTLDEEERTLFRQLEGEGVIRQAGMWDFLQAGQQYKAYPAVYRREAHWSITGACNLKCRHCFMSAPHARHGVPSHEEIVCVADQLAECGVFNVSLTGGEPLIRDDFMAIVDLLNERGIGINTIFTNGWLIDEKLLDGMEAKGMHPAFQLSFDGIGCHDYLRGIEGAEERTVRALKLLKERHYDTAVSMCLHRGNISTLREAVKLMASLDVGSMKCGSIMNLGEWMDPEVRSLRLTREEEMSLYETYIPEYFADDAPLAIMLSGAFMYSPGESDWGSCFHRECSAAEERDVPACGVLQSVFYIGADGMVAPCQGMCDCAFARNLPSLRDHPLREILTDSVYVQLSDTTVGDVRDGNEECRRCEYLDRCAGGCRNSALIVGDNYCGPDPEACFFFKNGWEDRISSAVKPAFEAYLKRNPPKETGGTQDSQTPVCL